MCETRLARLECSRLAAKPGPAQKPTCGGGGSGARIQAGCLRTHTGSSRDEVCPSSPKQGLGWLCGDIGDEVHSPWRRPPGLPRAEASGAPPSRGLTPFAACPPAMSPAGWRNGNREYRGAGGDRASPRRARGLSAGSAGTPAGSRAPLRGQHSHRLGLTGRGAPGPGVAERAPVWPQNGTRLSTAAPEAWVKVQGQACPEAEGRPATVAPAPRPP